MPRKKRTVSRRSFLASSLAGVVAGSDRHLLAANPTTESRQATGVKVGEVAETTAIVWMRSTANTSHNAEGKVMHSAKGEPLPKDVKIEDLRGACPGASGFIRLVYGTKEDLAGAKSLDWTEVTEKTDYAHQFRISGLQPGTV